MENTPLERRVALAIHLSMQVYKSPEYQKWARAWLKGKDRSQGAAEATWMVAWAASGAAEAVAQRAAASAAWAGAVDEAAAKAAAWAVDEAAYSILYSTALGAIPLTPEFQAEYMLFRLGVVAIDGTVPALTNSDGKTPQKGSDT